MFLRRLEPGFRVNLRLCPALPDFLHLETLQRRNNTSLFKRECYRVSRLRSLDNIKAARVKGEEKKKSCQASSSVISFKRNTKLFPLRRSTKRTSKNCRGRKKKSEEERKLSEAQLWIITAFHFQHDEIIWLVFTRAWFSSKETGPVCRQLAQPAPTWRILPQWPRWRRRP